MNESKQPTGESNSLPGELVQQCNTAIAQLQKLLTEMRGKKESILKQKEDLDSLLDELSKANAAVKINHKEKAAFENDCAQYVRALENLILEIDAKISAWEKIAAKKPPEKQEELVGLAIVIHHNAENTKKFIKKIKKDTVVIHSRFAFRFELQQKHLNALRPVKK